MTKVSEAYDVLEPFADLIGKEFIEFLFDAAPQKVVARIAKALDHYMKANQLRGI